MYRKWVISLQTMYEDLKADLRRFALSIASHQQDAHDLIQVALEKALFVEDIESWPRYKQKAWFYRVMKNHLIDERRKHQREMEWDEMMDLTLPSGTISALEMVDLLKRLPEIQSDIVFKKYWVGLTSKEIAENLNIPASTVRYHLSKAISALRNYLEEE
ncbi:RNA polymerase sigma-70 factor, ECF subfamily [Cytobacillus horneckiae]|nr:RNA polymerase sigma factor [Cytobacillus horneckiae]MBN6888216.1 RNA polymerase sigma factor [Cytobacillus horneckiae]MED2940264.1 RNA polymerase sigma factor [Cytobacillus horneckiae]NRG45844.1 RNA polymerase sigma factor [Bacillus sp. CRN 9]